jgi:hypothetical protein
LVGGKQYHRRVDRQEIDRALADREREDREDRAPPADEEARSVRPRGRGDPPDEREEEEHAPRQAFGERGDDKAEGRLRQPEATREATQVLVEKLLLDKGRTPMDGRRRVPRERQDDGDPLVGAGEEVTQRLDIARPEDEETAAERREREADGALRQRRAGDGEKEEDAAPSRPIAPIEHHVEERERG